MAINKIFYSFFLIGFGLIASLAGQDFNQEIASQAFHPGGGETREYHLGAGDLIEISVYGVDDFRHDLRISASGEVTIPHIGPLTVAGMTTGQLERLLTQEIENRELIRNAQVAVFVKEYRSQPVYVLGAVQRPGMYMVTHQLFLVDVLALAGGLDLNRAGDIALLQRPRVPGEAVPVSALESTAEANANQEITRIDLKMLLEQGTLELNQPIKGGDVILVPERTIEVFYVIGEVGRPGAFALPDEREAPLLVTQAIAEAGGPQKTAKMSRGILVRYEETGERKEYAVDFSDILRGRKANFEVQANDIIFIPGSNFKTLGYGLLGMLPGTVTRTSLLPLNRRGGGYQGGN